MNRNDFWNLIDSTRPKSGNVDQHLSRLEKALAKLEARDLLDFEKIRVELSHESYDARLWEVVAILCGGGCGDDSFSYFRDWLKLQGEAAFTRVLREPERLPEWYPPGKLDFADGFGSLAMSTFSAKFPERNFDVEYDGPYGPGELKGDLYRTEEELQAKYPELWDRYLGEYD